MFFYLLAVFFSTALVGAVLHNIKSYAVHESLAEVTGETITGDISGSVSTKITGTMSVMLQICSRTSMWIFVLVHNINNM